MKKKELESIVKSLDDSVEGLIKWCKSNQESIEFLSGKIEPEDEYQSIHDKKIIQETRRIEIENEKELRNLIPREEVEINLEKLFLSIGGIITDKKEIEKLKKIFSTVIKNIK